MASTTRKQETKENVYELALERTRIIFERHDKVSVSFSGGKDSTACLNIALIVARELNKLPLEVVSFDEEAIPVETEEYMRRVASNPEIDFKWFCVQLQHRNACSRSQPYWNCWKTGEEHLWTRPLPPEAILEIPNLKINPDIADCCRALYPPSKGTVGLIMGIRAQESLTRLRAITNAKISEEAFMRAHEGAPHMTKCYPIYDWTTEDVWRAPDRFGWDYNRAYDIMQLAGIPLSHQRCCPPYGEQPLRRLDTFKTCWPEMWAKMCDRVPGAATAARYANTELYGVGVKEAHLPEGKTWEQLCKEGLRKLKGEAYNEVLAGINMMVARHKKFSDAPLPDAEADFHSGFCWRLFYPMVQAGGDKFCRQTQKIASNAIKVRTANNVFKRKRKQFRKTTTA